MDSAAEKKHAHQQLPNLSGSVHGVHSHPIACIEINHEFEWCTRPDLWDLKVGTGTRQGKRARMVQQERPIVLHVQSMVKEV
jgi:hypothetical protein